MKKAFLISGLILMIQIAYACPVCEANQPKLLKGITHGAGPQSNWDYVAGIVTLIIVLIVLYYTIKWLIHPGEKETNHIKRSVLNF